jgi:hypothetical protein
MTRSIVLGVAFAAPSYVIYGLLYLVAVPAAQLAREEELMTDSLETGRRNR